MSRSRRLLILALATAANASCAHRDRPSATCPQSRITPSTHAAPVPTTPAMLPYAQIPPVLKLPTTIPSTQRAPLEALDLYARARTSMLDGRRFTALSYLERAATVDPDSASVQRLLAQAYVEADGGLGKAAAALVRATELEPDDLDTWVRLSRLQLALNQKAEALRSTRLAALTPEYGKEPGPTALVDLYLARMLQANGYDRAALDRFDLVLKSLATSASKLRDFPDLVLIMQRPELLYGEIATLYERNNQFADAARVLEAASRRDPDAFDLQARYVRALSRAGDTARATTIAGVLVVRFRADGRSMGLLAEVYKNAGGEDQMADGLRLIYDQRPGDRAILLALVEVLKSQGKSDAAEAVLEQSFSARAPGATTAPMDAELLRRLVDIRAEKGDLPGAARAIISRTAASPDDIAGFQSVMNSLTRPSRENRLHLTQLSNLDVPLSEKALRDYFTAILAAQMTRIDLVRTKLDAAANTFPTALLLLTDWTIRRADISATRRDAILDDLTARARTLGGAALAKAVEGRRLSALDKTAEAAQTLTDAVDAGVRDISTQLRLVGVLRKLNQPGLADQVLLGLAAAHLEDVEVQLALYNRLLEANKLSDANRVLADISRAAPTDISVRIAMAAHAARRRDIDTAIQISTDLLRDAPDSEDAVQITREIYTAAGQIFQWNTILAAQFNRTPRAIPVWQQMLANAVMTGQNAEAIRVINRVRAAAQDDPDLLYVLYGMCLGRFDDQTHEILADILKLDPHHAPAANDFAYELIESSVVSADQLAQAEKLSALAVQYAPENASYIDTRGWIFYKASRFPEAIAELKKAILFSPNHNVTILDHLGDAQWRAGDREAATQAWLTAIQAMDVRPANDDDETAKMRPKLQAKVAAAGRGENPDLAPVVAPAAAHSPSSVPLGVR